jgi:hypothetical protein
MRHLIVGALLVMAGLAITSVTATLLERAAVARKNIESAPAPIIVQSPPSSSPTNTRSRPEPGRDFINASHRVSANVD